MSESVKGEGDIVVVGVFQSVSHLPFSFVVGRATPGFTLPTIPAWAGSLPLRDAWRCQAWGRLHPGLPSGRQWACSVQSPLPPRPRVAVHPRPQPDMGPPSS